MTTDAAITPDARAPYSSRTPVPRTLHPRLTSSIRSSRDSINCRGVMLAGRRASAGAPFGWVFTHFRGAFAETERSEERTRRGQRSCIGQGRALLSEDQLALLGFLRELFYKLGFYLPTDL